MVRIGIAGCGRAARIHLGRLLAEGGVRVVGMADPDPDAARALAALVPPDDAGGTVPIFADHKELLARVVPDALSIFCPPRAHYRPAMDALQAGCHAFIERPFTTVSQEADDIVNLARGRARVVAIGHQYRLRPALAEARRRLAEGAIGQVRLVTAVLSAPWLAAHQTPRDAWRLDPTSGGRGLVADVGDHLLDALLWTTGRRAVEVAAFATEQVPGLDVASAAAVRLDDGTPATLSLSGLSPRSLFELTYYGDAGRLRATDAELVLERGGGPAESVPLAEPSGSIDGDFLAAVRGVRPPCCPAEEAVGTVRLLEALARSAATGQVVRLA